MINTIYATLPDRINNASLKDRTITLHLKDIDVQRIWKKAAVVGLTVPQL